MTSLTRWITWLSNLGVGLSGLILLWMSWMLVPEDPYAVVNHPAQPLWKNIHLWLSPLLGLNIGYLWCQHAWSYWRGKVRNGRRSGMMLLASGLIMVFSGPFLQTAIDENVRLFWSIIHSVSGCVWILAILIHIILHQTAARRGSSPTST